VLAVYAERARGQFLVDSIWKGGNGNWGTASNWIPGIVPNNGNGGSDYDATIGAGFATLDTSPTIQRFTFNGGTLITTGRTLTLKDRMAWNSGVFSGTGVVHATLGINMSGTNERRIHDGQVINHAGSGTWSGSVLNMISAHFNNLSAGSIDLQDGMFNTGAFNNAGTLRKSTAGSYSLLPTSFTNSGTIHVDAGFLGINRATTHTGLIDGAGSIGFGGSGTTTFAPSSQLLTDTVRFASGTAVVNGGFGPRSTTIDGANVTISGPQQYPAGATMHVSASRLLTLNSDAGGAGTGAGNLTLYVVFGARATFNSTQRFNELGFGSAVATLTEAAGPIGSKAVVARTFNFGGPGRLDVTHHGAVIDHTGSSFLNIMRGYVVSGYGTGSWNGTSGITSSLAAANPQTGIGYAEASDVLGLSGTQTATFLGTTVDASSTLARYTLLGDANLDAQVDFNDLVRLAQNYNVTNGSRRWPQGDFNYDGNVDFNDLVKLAQNYNTGLVPVTAPPVGVASFDADWARALASVPEPGMGLLGAGAGIALSTRRRRSRGSKEPGSSPPAPNPAWSTITQRPARGISPPGARPRAPS
jgi:hypothetical protein